MTSSLFRYSLIIIFEPVGDLILVLSDDILIDDIFLIDQKKNVCMYKTQHMLLHTASITALKCSEVQADYSNICCGNAGTTVTSLVTTASLNLEYELSPCETYQALSSNSSSSLLNLINGNVDRTLKGEITSLTLEEYGAACFQTTFVYAGNLNGYSNKPTFISGVFTADPLSPVVQHLNSMYHTYKWVDPPSGARYEFADSAGIPLRKGLALYPQCLLPMGSGTCGSRGTNIETSIIYDDTTVVGTVNLYCDIISGYPSIDQPYVRQMTQDNLDVLAKGVDSQAWCDSDLGIPTNSTLYAVLSTAPNRKIIKLGDRQEVILNFVVNETYTYPSSCYYENADAFLNNETCHPLIPVGNPSIDMSDPSENVLAYSVDNDVGSPSTVNVTINIIAPNYCFLKTSFGFNCASTVGIYISLPAVTSDAQCTAEVNANQVASDPLWCGESNGCVDLTDPANPVCGKSYNGECYTSSNDACTDTACKQCG